MKITLKSDWFTYTVTVFTKTGKEEYYFNTLSDAFQFLKFLRR